MYWMCVTAHLKWSEYNSLKSIRNFYHVSTKDLSWVVRLDNNLFRMQSCYCSGTLIVLKPSWHQTVLLFLVHCCWWLLVFTDTDIGISYNCVNCRHLLNLSSSETWHQNLLILTYANSKVQCADFEYSFPIQFQGQCFILYSIIGYIHNSSRKIYFVRYSQCIIKFWLWKKFGNFKCKHYIKLK